MGGAGPLMQVIDVLGHHTDPAPVLQIHQGLMRRVRAGRKYLVTTAVVKIPHQVRITRPGLGRGHILDVDLFPEPTRVPERGQTTLSTDPGAGQHHHVLAQPEGRIAPFLPHNAS